MGAQRDMMDGYSWHVLIIESSFLLSQEFSALMGKSDSHYQHL